MEYENEARLSSSKFRHSEKLDLENDPAKIHFELSSIMKLEIDS